MHEESGEIGLRISGTLPKQSHSAELAKLNSGSRLRWRARRGSQVTIPAKSADVAGWWLKFCNTDIMIMYLLAPLLVLANNLVLWKNHHNL